jgi:hypothetical protein
MYPSRLFAALALTLAVAGAHAQDLAATCHASSSYDVTVNPSGLLFDRASPAPRRVELQRGSLRTDGRAVPLRAEDRDRMALFERELRALLPRVRQLAGNGVDIAVRTLHEQAGQLDLSAATRAELDSRLASRQAELKQRIASSNSTHDWQGDAASNYANQISADLLPLVAGDLGQQALNAAMGGDLQGAAELRDRASDLASQLKPLLEQRLQALRPQVAALCPSIDRLAELQQGVRDANGQPLDLLQVQRQP